MNVFTKNGNVPGGGTPGGGARGRGRPRGTTDQGAETRRQLYEIAIRRIATKGYEGTTLRDVATEAGVSVGLLYRYFPSKRAVVLALYDELSAEYAARAAHLESGPWRTRFLSALRESLAVLEPHRSTLAALTPILVGDADEGLFAPATAFSRRRVEAVFLEAVRGAVDAPGSAEAIAVGRILYLLHLAVILWWLLDRSTGQEATRRLLGMLQRALPMASLALRLKRARRLVRAVDELVRRGLFGEEGQAG